jgi:hypothetical protein
MLITWLQSRIDYAIHFDQRSILCSTLSVYMKNIRRDDFMEDSLRCSNLPRNTTRLAIFTKLEEGVSFNGIISK